MMYLSFPSIFTETSLLCSSRTCPAEFRLSACHRRLESRQHDLIIPQTVYPGNSILVWRLWQAVEQSGSIAFVLWKADTHLHIQEAAHSSQNGEYGECILYFFPKKLKQEE